MLKRTARAVAESAGILTPSLPDALAAAETSRAAMVEAQAAREQAEAELQAGHDAGADEATIGKLEAALAAAKTAEHRAERAYIAVEKRLRFAQAAEAAKTKAAAAESRDKALAAMQTAAMELDKHAAAMATAAAAIDALYPTLNECRRDGVAAAFIPVTGQTLVDLAIRHAMALQAGAYTGDKPTAADTALRVAGAVKAAA